MSCSGQVAKLLRLEHHICIAIKAFMCGDKARIASKVLVCAVT